MKKIILALCIVTILSITGAASAASYAGYRDGAYRWTGFYAGGQGSYNYGRSDWHLDSGFLVKHDIDGGLFGVVAGYNYQMPNRLVLGLEGDMNAGRVQGSSSCPNTDFSCHTDVYGTALFRARLGLALDRFMPYVALGWSYAAAETRARFLPDGIEFRSSDAYYGWTPAAGFEIALTRHLLARAEYAYFGMRANHVFIQNTRADVDLRLNAFRFGLLFKF